MPPVVYANILQPLIDVCEAVLLFFHDSVGASWGLSIILLTFTVRIALLPLTLKQFKSMQRLQLLAPEMKKIQERYRNDRQRQQQEMMKFYRENQVNPLASCLPLLLQLPFFISLFYLLQDQLRFEICRQTAKACSQVPGYADSAQFLFIPDLTDKATGIVLIVLVLMYVGSQIASGLLSTATMDKNQRLIMLALPIVFIAFIINFPAGLMVYWITTNVWTIVQQLIIRKTMGPLRPARADGGKAVPAGAAAALAGAGGGSGKAPVKRSDNGAASGGPPPSARRRKKRSGRRR